MLRPPVTAVASLLALLLAGCNDRDLVTVPAQPSNTSQVAALPADRGLNEWLLDVCKQHKMPARLDGDWVVFSNAPVKLNAALAPETPQKTDQVILQLEFRALLPDGKLLAQPVVGWGKDRGEAIASAQTSFLLGSFHAFVGAFIDPAEEHVQREQRTIGGRKRVVTFGGILTKAVGEGQPPTDERWHEQLMREIDSSQIPPGTHWVDVYNGRVGDHQELEIQLDNERWTQMEGKMRSAPWPYNGTFTSVRQLLIIQDPDDRTRPSSPSSRPAPGR
jgi:hypothetical protein